MRIFFGSFNEGVVRQPNASPLMNDKSRVALLPLSAAHWGGLCRSLEIDAAAKKSLRTESSFFKISASISNKRSTVLD